MKITIKNLKQISYNVEITSEKPSVLDLKKEIEKEHGFDSTLLKLLFNGVVLDDSKNLEDYKIQDGSIIIMMNTKAKPKNTQSQPNNDSSQPKPEEKKPEEKNQVQPKQPEKKEEKPQGEKCSSQINSLVDMGFEKSQAEAAIKAARGQVDLAVEFLYNGIPEGIDDLDVDMGEGQGEGDEGEDNNEGDPVKDIASVAKIVCKDNPAALTELLQSIQQTNPELMALINEHEDDFKTYLEQPINENDYRIFQRFKQNMGGGDDEEEGHDHGHGEGHGQIRLNLSPEDQAAIQRLKDLGNFSEADVVQAYIACEKNEELTANYLFEQKMRDDDEMFGAHNNNNNGNGQ